MIEEKTLWAVTSSLEVREKTAIVDDGKLLAVKTSGSKDTEYNGYEYGVLKYLDTEEEAKQFAADEERYIRDMVPRVKKFISRMDFCGKLRERLGIKKEDYLDTYGNDNYRENARRWYDDECEYAKKLENFIHSRTLNIDGYMLPVDGVTRVQWYASSEEPDEMEADQWKAELTMQSGQTYQTATPEDVRLIWAVFGRASGTWYVDEDIDYDK